MPLVTDITIWTAPAASVRYESKGTDATRADVTGHRAGEEFTEADYVPVSRYPKPLRAVSGMDHAVAIVSTVNERRVTPAGRADAAIRLYTSIFNYRYLPAGGLSVHV